MPYLKYLILIILAFHSLLSSAQEDKTLWTVAWSPDDKIVAIGSSQGELKLFDGASFELIHSYSTGGVILSRLKWHPNQNKLAVITQSATFKAKILDLDKDEWIELEGLENSIRGLDWNYNGELLAVSGFDGGIYIFDIQGKRISSFKADNKSSTGLDWHPNKNILASVGSTIGMFDYRGDTIKIFEPREEEVFLLCVEWHNSGEFFATGDYGLLENADNKLIQFWNASGEKINEFGSSTVEYRNIRWSPDGNFLASANDALRIWDTKGNLVHESQSSEDYLWGIDWNSDGSKIITTSSMGMISLWDAKANLIRKIEF